MHIWCDFPGNISFDHYFGTSRARWKPPFGKSIQPFAEDAIGQWIVVRACSNNNPNLNPTTAKRAQSFPASITVRSATADQDHTYLDEQLDSTPELIDLFPAHTGNNKKSGHGLFATEIPDGLWKL